MSYGGVSRPVVLEEVDDLYIRYVHVTPYRDGGVQLFRRMERPTT